MAFCRYKTMLWEKHFTNHSKRRDDTSCCVSSCHHRYLHVLLPESLIGHWCIVTIFCTPKDQFLFQTLRPYFLLSHVAHYCALSKFNHYPHHDKFVMFSFVHVIREIRYNRITRVSILHGYR